MADKHKQLQALRAIPDDKLIDPKRDTTLKHIDNPDPMLTRLKMEARAKSEVTAAPACPHPISAIGQFMDTGPNTSKQREGRPTNLFQCDICNNLLQITDFWGRSASDG